MNTHSLSRIVRRTLCIVMMACVLMGVRAQQRPPEPPLYDARHAEQVIQFKPYLAMGVSSIAQNYGKVIPGLSDLQLSPGCMMRAGMDVRFMIRNSFGLATGLNFGINNTKYALTIVDNNNGSVNSIYMKNHFYDITVPIYATWRLNLGRRMVWNIDAGMYVARGVGGEMHASGYTSGHNSLGQPIITHVSHTSKYFKDGKALVNGVKRNDYGPHIGTGLTYNKHYSLDVVLEVSMPNLAINHDVLDVTYRDISFFFQFGYNF